jgi:tetratricopeptide (TPR) repeat protein
MATKETMVTAPLIVLLYDRIYLGGSFQEIRRKRWPLYVGLAMTWVVLGVLVTGRVRTESVGFGFENVGVADYARTQCGVIAHYLRLAFWPRPLVLDYYWPLARSLADVASSALLVACLIGATAWALVREPKLGFLGAWFFVVLAPTSSCLPIVTEIAAEHRMYLPLAAVVTLTCVAAYRLLGRTGGAVLLVVIAATLGGLTIERNRDYRSEISIWTDTQAKRPANPRAYNNLGTIYAEAGNYGEAIRYFREAVVLEPHFAYAHYNLAKALRAQKQVDEAVEHYLAALREKPKMTNVRLELAMYLGELGRIAEAVEQFSEALRTDPRNANAHYNLGVALARQGKLSDAVRHFAEAVRLQPNFAIARQALDDARARLATRPSSMVEPNEGGKF